MKKHERLVDQAKEAIDAVFSDTSVDKETTRDSLWELAGEIEVKLEGLSYG